MTTSEMRPEELVMALVSAARSDADSSTTRALARALTERLKAAESGRDAAVAEERKACAKIVLDGGDGQDRLETAIQLGTNAAIAEAILARGTVRREG